MVLLAAGGSFIDNPENWVIVAFLVFFGILYYLGVFNSLGKALDSRAEKIKKELDDARRLREEAQALLADYQKKAREAEAEAKSIIDNARKEAEAMARQTRVSLAEGLERRTKLAEDKIARAEAQALNEVRASAVEAAIGAAEQILGKKAGGETGNKLIEDSIKGLSSRLN